VAALPALARGHITFGSFNKYNKVSPQVLDAWLQILAAVPESRLLVLAQRGGHAEARLRERAAVLDIAPSRIEFADRQSHADYMKLVGQVDIALDPFPFNGHTTTCDALWMGVPVVTLAGRNYASRFGSSAHMNLGLCDLIAQSVGQYIEIAVALATDLPALAKLRSELRPRMQASPLLDFVGFTRRLEASYRDMWRNWCQRAR
jgi:predicted O-linked N-acetylglucosamine transferase (SPINDLY family)